MLKSTNNTITQKNVLHMIDVIVFVMPFDIEVKHVIFSKKIN